MISWLREVIGIVTRRHAIFQRQRAPERGGSVVTFRANGPRSSKGRLQVSWLAPRLILFLFVVLIAIGVLLIAVAVAFVIELLTPTSAPLNAAPEPSTTQTSAIAPATTTTQVPPTTTVVVTLPVTPPVGPNVVDPSATTRPTATADDAPEPVADDIGVSVGVDEGTIEVGADVVLDLPLLDIQLNLGIGLVNVLAPPTPEGATP